MLIRPPHTAVLYANLSLPSFCLLREFLDRESGAMCPHLEYVPRHVLPHDHEADVAWMYLSGCNITLDLKERDYLALSDDKVHRVSFHLS